MLKIFIIVLLFAFEPSAFATGNPPYLTMQALGAVLSRSILVTPMHTGIWQVKLAASKVTNNSNDSQNFNNNSTTGSGFSNDMTGQGLTISATKGFNEHWGTSVLLGYTTLTGTRSLNFRNNSGALLFTPPAKVSSLVSSSNNSINGVSGDCKGAVGSISVIWDHWEGEGFRFPLYLGAGAIWEKEKADQTQYGVKRTADVLSPAIQFGLAPSINYHDFRASGFFMIVAALSPGTSSIVDYQPQTGSVNSQTTFNNETGMEAAFPIAGVAINYQPWNLGLSFAPDITGEGAKSVALDWTFNWGEGSK